MISRDEARSLYMFCSVLSLSVLLARDRNRRFVKSRHRLELLGSGTGCLLRNT